MYVKTNKQANKETLMINNNLIVGFTKFENASKCYTICSHCSTTEISLRIVMELQVNSGEATDTELNGASP